MTLPLVPVPDQDLQFNFDEIAQRFPFGAEDIAAGSITEAALSAALVTLLHSPGDVKLSARSSPETGWLACNGAAVSRTTYADLFTAIGTTWGIGDGSTTFNVPDGRGRAPVGVGTGSGLTARALAASGGEESHALSTGELATHSHDVQRTNTAASATGTDTSTLYKEQAGTGTAFYATQNAGSGTAHNNMQPYLALNFYIKT